MKNMTIKRKAQGEKESMGRNHRSISQNLSQSPIKLMSLMKSLTREIYKG
jgi:hypothetical protein